MPERVSPRAKPLGLYHLQRDLGIPSTVLAELVGSSRKVLERVARGQHSLSLHRRERIEGFLRHVGVPAAQVARAFQPSSRPLGGQRGGVHQVRCRWLYDQIPVFLSQAPAPEESVPPDLLHLEAPVLTRSHLPVEACVHFDFLDSRGQALDPFFREFKDPAHGQYSWPGYLAARDALLMAARERAFFALIAPPASGKSFLLARVRTELRERGYEVCEPALLTKGRCTEGAILNSILSAVVGEGVRPANSLDRRCRQLYDILLSDKGRRNVVLVLDEAQDLPPLALRVLKRLYDWSYGVYDNLLSIILVGHPALRNTLRTDLSVREAGRRVILHELAPLDDLGRYLEWRLAKALGHPCDLDRIFGPDGLAAVGDLLDDLTHLRTDWRPLLVNTLLQAACDLAWRLAEPRITAAVLHRLHDQIAKGER